MNDTIDRTSLQRLGDRLAVATERDLRPPARRPIGRVILAVAVLAIVGTGTAAATGLFSPKQVAAAMPAGAVIFDQTDPSCVLDVGGNVFHCTLSSAPAAEVSDYTGSKQLLVASGVVAGGCIGQDKAGMHWDCFIGQDAVDHEIVTQDFLGQPAGPGHG
jgi:hypothetical protein